MRFSPSLERCKTCGRNLAGHIKDIEAGFVKAHPFNIKKGKK